MRADGVLIGGEGEVGVMEGEGEEEGGWDVGDDDLDLPPDLVREQTDTYTPASQCRDECHNYVFHEVSLPCERAPIPNF